MTIRYLNTRDVTATIPASLCGCSGLLTTVGGNPEEAHVCFLWWTDPDLIRQTPVPQSSLFELACEVAELYHRRALLRLPEALWRGEHQIIWLELWLNDTLRVLLKPV
jgi:hypothetical protein